MWLIGIRSGIITLLALIAYILLVQLVELKNSILGHLEHVVFALGIYSAHYYYKQAKDGVIAYKEAIQVGMITVVFTSVVITALTWNLFLIYGEGFIDALLTNVTSTIQQIDANHLSIQNEARVLKILRSPTRLIMMIFLSINLTGFIFTLLIGLFVRTKKHQ